MQRLLLIFIALLFCVKELAVAQNDFFQPSVNYDAKRLKSVIITEVAVTTVVMAGLNYLWYKKFPRSRFHFFNDNAEWLNMDKAGHIFSAYNIATIQNDVLRWSGVRPVNAAVAATATSFGIMTMIEILDGFSSQWGFSTGDMLANMSGCLAFQGQQWMWDEQRISIKFSYHHTMYSKYYPQELGRNLPERLMKDYNGQTYWISANIGSFLSNNDFPKWLNVAAGYSAEGMIGARSNQIGGNENNTKKDSTQFKRYRKYFLSLDTDAYRIDDLSPFYRTLFKINRLIKTPAPAIEWNKENGGTMHLVYF